MIEIKEQKCKYGLRPPFMSGIFIYDEVIQDHFSRMCYIDLQKQPNTALETPVVSIQTPSGTGIQSAILQSESIVSDFVIFL